MKKLFPLLLAFVLTGCDTSQFFLFRPTVEPTNSTMCVFGQVVDRFNQPLPGAIVTNGADRFVTQSVETSVDLGTSNGGTMLLPPGHFVLRDIPVGDGKSNEGSATIRAIFDGVSSTPITVRLIKRTTNYSSKVSSNKSYHLMDPDTGSLYVEQIDALQDRYNVTLVELSSGDAEHAIPIAVEGPIQSNDAQERACVRYLGGESTYNRIDTAPTVTAEMATDSVKVYSPAEGIIRLVMQSPPGGAGTTIGSYTIKYSNTVTGAELKSVTKALNPPVIVMPAPAYESGQKAYVPVDTTAWGEWAAKVAGLNLAEKVPVSAKVTFIPQNGGGLVRTLVRTLNGSSTTPLEAPILLKTKTAL